MGAARDLHREGRNKKCRTPFELEKEVRKRLEAGEPEVKLRLYGPNAQVFAPLAGTLGTLKTRASEVLPGVSNFLYSNPTGVEELLAIAVVILAIGAAASVGIIATSVAFCLILALVLGYTSIKVKVIPGTQAQPLPSIEFELTK